jgi:hypothetical protein
MVKTLERPVVEDPDQMFFSFVTPPPRQAAVEQEWQPATTSRQAPAGSDRAYVTEARAAELFLQVARAQPDAGVTRAEVVFKPFRSTLYSFKIRRSGTARVKFHMAFRHAPEPVLTQAAELILTRRKKERRHLDRRAYDSFVRAIPPTDFELPGARRAHRRAVCEPGRHHSLAESFQRINAEYFKGQLEQPELCWSPVRARRILGSYQERTDRLIISRVFDAPHVPAFVLDYLVYHELLHKFLGTGRKADGKRCLHGGPFKQLEKRFRHYKQALQFLRRM